MGFLKRVDTILNWTEPQVSVFSLTEKDGISCDRPCHKPEVTMQAWKALKSSDKKPNLSQAWGDHAILKER